MSTHSGSGARQLGQAQMHRKSAVESVRGRAHEQASLASSESWNANPRAVSPTRESRSDGKMRSSGHGSVPRLGTLASRAHIHKVQTLPRPTMGDRDLGARGSASSRVAASSSRQVEMDVDSGDLNESTEHREQPQRPEERKVTMDQREASVLYQKFIPVQVSETGRDDRSSLLTVRISLLAPSASIQSAAPNILHVRVTDEEDPFFLYTLNVSDLDFHALKREQNILVDFTNFPGNVVELLEECLACQDDEQPKFVAVLDLSVDRSVLSVVETNQFKQLVHLALDLRPGNDEDIKKYLAGRVTSFKAANAQLEESLQKTQEEAKSLNERVEDLKEQCDELQAQRKQQVDSVRVQYAQQETDIRESHLAERQEMQARFESELQQLQRDHQQRVAELEQRCRAYSEQNSILTKNNFELETNLRQTAQALDRTKEEAEDNIRELRELRGKHLSLDSTRFEQEKSLSKQQLQLVTLEQQLKAREELIDSLKKMLQQGTEQRSGLEQSVSMFKQSAEKAEEKLLASLQDNDKANKVIQHLQRDIHNLKSKLKLKSTVIVQQEQELERKREAITTVQRQLDNIQGNVARLAGENENLTQALHRSKHQLKDSQQQLESNSKVIEWLNKELNDAKLGKVTGTTSNTGSTFRPTVGFASFQTPMQTSSPTEQKAPLDTSGYSSNMSAYSGAGGGSSFMQSPGANASTSAVAGRFSLSSLSSNLLKTRPAVSSAYFSHPQAQAASAVGSTA